MNPDRLLQHFEQVSEAPDAVPRLRRFVLDLAVRGKLVEQDSDDEPAALLLKRIEAEKARLAKAGKLGKVKDLAPVDEVPFKIPGSWAWAPIRQITADRGQKVPAARFSYIDVSAIDNTRGVVAGVQVLEPDAAPSRARKIVRQGDVIYSCVRPYLLNIAVVSEAFDPEPIASTAFAVLDALGLVVPQYLWIALRSPFFVGIVEAQMRGQAYPAINDRDFAPLPLPLPLPPLPEQHRIVAKVDELMALCDELEAAQAKREARRDRLVAATLHGLEVGRDAVGRDVVGRDGSPSRPPAANDKDRGALGESALPTAGGFGETALPTFLGNLPRLTTRPEHIQQLRQTILNLAVRGRLVEQKSGDEPAKELLAEVATARADALARGTPNEAEAKVQVRKQEEQDIPADLPELPENWQWATLMQCSLLVVDCHNKTAPYAPEGIPLLRTTNIRNGRLILDDLRFVSVSTFDRWSARCAPAPGDILITREAPMGEVAQIPSGVKVCMGQRLMLVRLVPETIDPAYLVYTIRAPDLLDRVQDKPVGATVQHLRVGGVETLLVPVPPRAEQHRIVAKVDELMGLCDELEAQLAAGATTRTQLLEATLAEALGRDAFGRDGSPSRPLSANHQNRGALGESALPNNIPQSILAHMQPGVLYSRADITEALGISNADWTWAIRQLKESGRVLQTGDRRGSRYSTISNL